MEICKNKKTGMAFVYLDESDNGCALMITPSGQVMELEEKLFTAPEEMDGPESAHTQGLINSAQYKAYCIYHR